MNIEDKTVVTVKEVQAALQNLKGWNYDSVHKALVRVWSFEKYVPTMKFIRELTKVMDQENHHSDLVLDGKSKTLTVKVTTFSESAVTRADLAFAEVVNGLEDKAFM